MTKLQALISLGGEGDKERKYVGIETTKNSFEQLKRVSLNVGKRLQEMQKISKQNERHYSRLVNVKSSLM